MELTIIYPDKETSVKIENTDQRAPSLDDQLSLNITIQANNSLRLPIEWEDYFFMDGSVNK